MNKHVRPEEFIPAVRAPSDLPRRSWTFDEVLKAEAAGVFEPDERFELIDGELVLMAAKGIKHELVKTELVMYWGRKRPDSLKFGSETPFRLNLRNVPEPDFVLFPANLRLVDLSGPAVMLAVEVAKSSRSRDLGYKAKLYAQFGVREHWVIEAETLTTIVHKGPLKQGYSSVHETPPAELLTPEFAPEMAVRMADLELDAD